MNTPGEYGEPGIPKPTPALHVEEEEDFVHDEFSDDPFNFDENILSPKAKAALSELEAHQGNNEGGASRAEELLDEALARDPFEGVEERLFPSYLRSRIIPVRTAYLTSALLFASKADRETAAALMNAESGYREALWTIREGPKRSSLDGSTPADPRRPEREALAARIEKNDLSVVASFESVLAGSGALASRIRDVEERFPPAKRSLIGKLAESKVLRNLRGVFMALAAFTVASDTPEAPPHTYATEDVSRAPSPASPAESSESAASITIAIPTTGAIEALKDVVAHANQVSWLPDWLESVRQTARPDLVRTREGRLDVMAQRLGFLTYMPGEGGPNGAWIAHSSGVPAGATLKLNEHGLSVRMPDGSVQELISVDERGVVNEQPYAG